MGDERVYAISTSQAEPATPVTLADAGLRERSDLQEWVIARPEMLGADVLVVTTEFDRWVAGGGARPLDRLDVLGLDAEGRLVVAELKRDRAPDTVEMQAIKYAAFASRFEEDTLVEHHRRHLSRVSGHEVDAESAHEALVAHAGELDPETLRRPRIVLVAGEFPPSVTATTVWLSEMGVEVALQQVQAYRLPDGQVIVSVTQLYPVPDVEEFTVAPARAAARRTGRRRQRSAIVRLVDSKTIADDTGLTLTTDELAPAERAVVEAWVAEDPKGLRARATWRNDRAKPIVWAVDGTGYRPTPLARHILAEAGLEERPLRGSAWWMLPDGSTLLDTALNVAGGFDWAALHMLLADVGEGRWTTYGDLASAVGTGALAVGRHMADCGQCTNAWRVLGADGSPREGFRWSDPARTETQEQVLRGEGVPFVEGRADSNARIPIDELQARVGAQE